MDYESKAEAVATEAEKLAANGDFFQATKFYENALSLLLGHVKLEEDPAKKKSAQKVAVRFLERAETLKEQLALNTPEEEAKRQQREHNVALLKLQHQMKKDRDLVVTHTIKSKRIPNCFSGSALVTWLMKKGHASNVMEAIRIGQDLVDASLVIHVNSDQMFSKSSALYRCIDQEIYTVHVQMRDPASGLAKLDPSIKPPSKKKKNELGNEKVLDTSVKFPGSLVIDWLMDFKPLGFKKREEAQQYAGRLLENYLIEGGANLYFMDTPNTMYNFVRELASVATLFDPTLTGWMMCHWSTNSWKKRFFVLVGDQQRLYCFDSETAEKPKGNLDLRRCILKPVDESLFNRKYCFEVIFSGQSLYCCPETEENKNEWMQALQKCVPEENLLESHRKIRSLSLKIGEARVLPTDVPNYYCVVYLQGRKIVRTQVQWKQKDGAPVWNEEFQIDEIPPSASTLEINVFSKKVGLLGKDSDLGFGCLSLENLVKNETVDDILVVQKTGSAVRPSSFQVLQLDTEDLYLKPNLQIQYTMTEELVLPLYQYWELVQLLSEDFEVTKHMCNEHSNEILFLELLQLLESQGKALAFVIYMLEGEIARTENKHLLFRENTAATKFVVLYLRVIALEYVKSIVDLPAMELVARIEEGKIQADGNESEFTINTVSLFWQSINTSAGHAPLPLKLFCKELWNRLEEVYPDSPQTSYMALASFLFLRTICPAIISFKSFDAVSDSNDALLTKCLRTSAKVLQLLAVFKTDFRGHDGQDDKLVQSFLAMHAEKMREFLDLLCMRKETRPLGELPVPAVDLERVMGSLYLNLCAIMPQIRENCFPETSAKVVEVLSNISACYAEKWPNSEYTFHP